MKFFVAAAALVAGVSAAYPASNVTYTTIVTTAYETYCPGPTSITYGTNTYTVTEATTLTITDCPCTISVPVYTTSSVVCSTCSSSSSSAPVYPTETPVYPTSEVSYPTVYPNGTVPTSATTYSTGGVIPTTYPSETPIPTAGAGKLAMSGAGLVGVLGAALLL